MAFASSQNLQSSFVSSRTSIEFKRTVLVSERHRLANRIGQLVRHCAMLLLDPLQPLFQELELLVAAQVLRRNFITTSTHVHPAH